MKLSVRSSAAVLLAVSALCALGSAGGAQADPRERSERGRGRSEGRAEQRYGGPRAYSVPPGVIQGYERYPGRDRAYEAPRVYAPPPPPPPPPPSSYYQPRRPNSLGAQWGQQQDEARSAVRQGRILPLARVLQTLQKLRPGRVLDAGIESAPDGRQTYRVRWAATGGRRMDFIVDAETGAVIGRGAE